MALTLLFIMLLTECEKTTLSLSYGATGRIRTSASQTLVKITFTVIGGNAPTMQFSESFLLSSLVDRPRVISRWSLILLLAAADHSQLTTRSCCLLIVN
jgi:hypothetical protein